MKKRPTWATVVGILGIAVSSLGILGAGQIIMMPKMMEFQKQMFSDVSKQMDNLTPERGDSSKKAKVAMKSIKPDYMFERMQKMWNIPDWYNKWAVVIGLAQLIIYGFYLFACIRLLQVKTSAIKMFYFAAGTKIFHGIVSGFVAAISSSFMIMAMMAWSIVGIVIHIVLLIVVATGDKDAFLFVDQ